MRPRSNQVDRAVDGNPVQPGAEVGARLESAQLPIGLEKRFLHDVLGVRRTPRHAVRQPVDGPTVAFHELPEGFAVAVAGQRDGGGVRLRHPIG
jgi:hypothetical protein